MELEGLVNGFSSPDAEGMLTVSSVDSVVGAGVAVATDVVDSCDQLKVSSLLHPISVAAVKGTHKHIRISCFILFMGSHYLCCVFFHVLSGNDV